ncbi:MAG TPA: TRAP transporter substrate-binding protein DctP [Beijerinckiaceae bacterium]|jgi:TRAP-type C4-dicarboxylate transport system substrate-binding protein
MHKMILGALAAASFAAASAGAHAQSLRYNTFMTPKALESMAAPKFFDELSKATNGKVRGQVFAGGQLLGGQATLGGIRDGVVDVGFIVPTLNSSEIPSIAMMPELLPFADSFWGATGASNETPMLTCPECVEELQKVNAVWLGGFGASPWYLMCRAPISSLADLRGRKVRVTGGFATRMIAAFGGVGVALTPGEIGPAMQQGQIDCTVGNLAWLTTLGLVDSVRAIVDLPLGSYHGLGMFVFNRKSLDRLSADEKKAMIDIIPRHLTAIVKAYEDQEKEARAAAEAKKIAFWPPSADFKDALAKFKEGEVKAAAADMQKFGARNAEENVRKHLENLKTWGEIAARVKNDPDAMAKELTTRVFSKIKI